VDCFTEKHRKPDVRSPPKEVYKVPELIRPSYAAFALQKQGKSLRNSCFSPCFAFGYAGHIVLQGHAEGVGKTNGAATED